MEREVTCILVNLPLIYQSFYDMLNQSYIFVNGKAYARVSIETISTICLVNDKFKCVLIIKENVVKDYDPPLLNRFEKHFIHSSNLLDVKNTNLKERIKTFIQTFFKPKGFIKKDSLPTLTNNNINSLILKAQKLLRIDNQFIEEDLYNFCLKQIIWLSNYEGIIRLKYLVENDDMVSNIVNLYTQSQRHKS
jgi:hypothetical protein